MNKHSTLLGLCFLFSAILTAQDIKRIGNEELFRLLNIDDNKLHVVNFWATWCGPCVKELPAFETAMDTYPVEKVEFHFVSLDFPGSAESTLSPFIENRPVQNGVVLMTNLDYDSWIRKVDTNWKGNIPSTLFYHKSKGYRQFHSGILDYNELTKILDQLIQKEG